MTQPVVPIDQIQIEPALSGTRLISAVAAGDLQLSDPNVTAVLLALVGLRNVTGVFIVGRAGDGAPYTAVQDAIDAIPATSSPALPSLVLILAGVYSETITIDKDGVHLIGLGAVSITNAAADATITIEDNPETTPQAVVLRDLVIENTGAGEECVLIEGAGTYASGTATAVNAPLAAGDTLTIGGTVLTGVAGTRTSGGDDFSVDGVTVAAIAAEISEAIDDSANSFYGTVTADYLAAVVTITASSPGVGGNAITLVTSTTPAGGITLSGATLTGGGAGGSEVALVGVDILDCDLVASGVGTYQVRANTVNNVRVQGGTWRGSSSTSLSTAVNCAAFRVSGVEWVNDFELAYDTGNDQPATLTSEYFVKDCGRANDFTVNLVGLGSMALDNVPSVGDLTLGGGRPMAVDYCRVGDVSLSGTMAATFAETTRGTLVTAAGSPTMAESTLVGSVAFAASALETVTFDALQPDMSYGVFLDKPAIGVDIAATTKVVGSFVLTADAPFTGTVFYAVKRQL
jgi:hypothetical protein